MKVLVVVATKHGATLEIGDAIATRLRARGLDVDVRRAGEVDDLDGVEAVVLGSGVYAGHWLREAREFVDRLEAELRTRPVWLFSSGPVGQPPKPLESPAEAVSVAKRLGARGQRLFAGRIDGEDLGLAERALVTLVRAPEGDYRPWPEIGEWAARIADSLTEGVTPG